MAMDGAAWLPLLILAPLLAALAAFVQPRWGYGAALTGGLATLGAAAALAVRLPQSGALRHTIGGWGAPLGIDLALDGMSMLMLLATAIIGILITVYARGYFAPAAEDESARRRCRYFWPLWLFLWAALNALFLSGDLFNLYVTLELLGFSAVALTALAGTPAVLKAAMRYLLVSLAGSLLYLMGVVFLYGGFGALDIAQLARAVSDTPALAAAAALITVGLVLKTALFPLHFWLPPAHANAAAPVSALLSALVVKGSFYILLRVWLQVLHPLAGTLIPHLLSALGVGAILWGSLQAIRQPRLKLLVAYSTVAQLGYLFLLLPILLRDRGQGSALAGILLFALAHAGAKAAAFLCAGNILRVVGDDRLRSFNGLMQTSPLTVAAFALAGVSLVALPPSGGFAAKWLMLEAALSHGAWGLAAAIVGGGLLAAVYIMRVIAGLFRQEPQPEGSPAAQPPPSLPASMALPALGLSLLAALLGFASVYLLDVLAAGPLQEAA